MAISPRALKGRPRDPLLATVRVVLSVAMLVATVLPAILLAAVPLVLAGRGRILAELSRRAGKALPPDFPYAICGILALIAISAICGFFFLRQLRRIVDSVAEGDPFIPENAVRLERMGWLAMLIQLIAIPAGALAGWVSYVGHVRYPDIGFSIGGTILALILFVLARIFRKGTQMRDDLEGTV